MRSSSSVVFLAASCSAFGCSSDPVDIGTDKTGERLSDYAASWDGYAEAYNFEGSGRIRLVLDANGEGTIEFGDAPAVPPPTVPNVGYLPEAPDPFGTDFSIPRVGLRYPVHEVGVESERIRFSAYPLEIYAAWCELQTPIFDELNSRYSCVPEGVGRDASGDACYLADGQTSIDCGKVALCSYVCACDVNGCGVPLLEPPQRFHVDAALEADASEFVGTLLIDGVRVTIRMTRQ